MGVQNFSISRNARGPRESDFCNIFNTYNATMRANAKAGSLWIQKSEIRKQ